MNKSTIRQINLLQTLIDKLKRPVRDTNVTDASKRLVKFLQNLTFVNGSTEPSKLFDRISIFYDIEKGGTLAARAAVGST